MNTEKNMYSKEIGFGVSIRPPSTFKKAKSYNGFQAPQKMGSIALEIEDNYEQLIITYSKETISARDGKIHRHQPVSYSGNTEAFYVEFYDKPQKRYRLVLVIKKDDKTYHFKGFHRGKPDNPLSNKIRMSILTAHIGEFKKEEKPFSVVFLGDDLQHFKYTRDNKYPTEEADSMVVNVTTLEKGTLQKYNQSEYLKEKVKAITNGPTSSHKESLANGMIYKCTSETNTKHVIGILLTSDQDNATLIECVGNEKANLNEVANYMLSQVTTVM